MDDFEKFYNKALKFLSYRPRSEKEIIDKLKSKKASDEVIKKVIKKLKEYKFLDDLEFVRWWIEQRTKMNPKGLRLIKIELKRKGIDDKLIEKINLKDRNDLKLVKGLVEKRIERYKKMGKWEVYPKLVRYLSSRGFSYDVIKESIDELFKKRV